MVSDLIFVSEVEFNRLRRENVGTFLTDNVGAQMIVLEDTIIRVYDIQPPEEPEEVVEEVV